MKWKKAVAGICFLLGVSWIMPILHNNFLSFAAGPEETAESEIPVYEGYSLVWNDEFEGPYLDQTKWRLGNTPENGRHKYNVSVNSEGQLENENVCLEDGVLKLKATDVEDYAENGKQYACNSGMVETYGKAGWRYGRIDVRAKLPVTKGMWPAIWMMPEKNVYGWPKDGEIDIMELISQEKNKVYGTIHCGTSGTSDYYHPAETYSLASGTYFDDYHLFSMEWDPGVIRLYVDQTLFAAFDNWVSVVDGTKHEFPHPFNTPFYLKLNLAAGGNWCENPDASTSWGEDSTMSVDYVRVYKRKNPAYHYGREAFLSSSHRQGPVWYAQKHTLNGWENMSAYNNGWKEDDLQITKNYMSPGTSDCSIGFLAPEDGYLKVRLLEEASSTQPFRLRFTKGTLENSADTLADLKVISKDGRYRTEDGTKYLYLPVCADDTIRLEASGSGNCISGTDLTVSYVTEEQYQKAVSGTLSTEVLISGMPAIGSPLLASVTEGPFSSSQYSYRWKADGENIPYATKQIWTPAFQELGKAITVQVTGPDGSVTESHATEEVSDHFFVDDSDPSVSYTGFGGQGNRKDAVGGTFHWSSNEVPSEILYTFTGTGIEMLAYTHTYWTKHQTVTITDSSGSVVSLGEAICYGTNGGKTTAYKNLDLPYGTYTISIKNDGTKNKVEFDGFYLYNTGSSTDPYPVYSLSFSGGEGAFGNGPQTESHSEGYPFTLPDCPFRKEGYKFLGWAAPNGLYAPGELFIMPDEPLLFTAQWEHVPPKPEPDDQTPPTDPPAPQPPSVQIPGKPAKLKASLTSPKSITLTWKKVAGADGYILSRYDAKTKKWMDVKTTVTNRFRDFKLKKATLYKYRVRAYALSGKEKKEGTPCSALKAATAPSKPRLRLKRTGTASIKLIWNRGTKADGFRIYMKKGKGSFRRLSWNSKKTFWKKSKLKAGATYAFRIRGFKKAGKNLSYSPYSNTVKITFA